MQAVVKTHNIRIEVEIIYNEDEELGQKLVGIPRQNISNMEKDRRTISKEMAKKLAELFYVSVEKFI